MTSQCDRCVWEVGVVTELEWGIIELIDSI